jgi:hypothetical protein
MHPDSLPQDDLIERGRKAAKELECILEYSYRQLAQTFARIEESEVILSVLPRADPFNHIAPP